MRLIDADVLKSMVTEGTDRAPEGIQTLYIECVQKIVQAVVECIDKIPIVDVVPMDYHKNCLMLAKSEKIRHGRWQHLGGDEWSCTVCGEIIHTEGSWEKPTSKYCCECGTKMDAGQEGENDG